LRIITTTKKNEEEEWSREFVLTGRRLSKNVRRLISEIICFLFRFEES